MKKLAVLFALLGVVFVGVASADNVAFIQGQGVHAPGSDTDPCPPSVLYMNHDGSTENAFTWQNQGVVAPDYGAFAEGYSGVSGVVCGAELFLTSWATMTGTGVLDIYVWEYDVPNDNPGAVLSLTTPVAFSGVGYWPVVTTHDIDIVDAIAGPDGFFVGYWPGSWAGLPAQFGCAMDEDGFGGVPRTNIAPGIGYPTGWANPSVAGYILQAFGLGGWVGGDTPVQETSWGAIKNLYN
jgi:hypothetical protein